MARKHKWSYSGDVNLEYGGFFWREDGAEDYVLAVRVTPCSDAGGPNNLFHVEQGSTYLPSDAGKRKSALDTIGVAFGEETRRDLVEAFIAYHGIERHAWGAEQVLRIGKPQECSSRRGDGWNPAPDFILRSNSSLERFVKRQFLD